jgi:hypothetical protein
MSAVVKNLDVEQGATYEFGFFWMKAAAVQGDDPVPYDLSGAVVRMQIRKNQQAELLVDASSDTGTPPMITLGGATGRIDVRLTALATSALTLKTAAYDLEVEMADGTVRRLLKGAVTIDPNITQSVGEPVLS